MTDEGHHFSYSRSICNGYIEPNKTDHNNGNLYTWTRYAFSTLTINHPASKSKLSSISRRRNLIVQQRRQEIRIVFTGNLSRKVSSGELVFVALGCLGGK